MTLDLLNPPEDTITIDPNKNYRAELVGEGRKFKTDEDLARGKFESDLYIKTLESKLDDLRKDYLKEREDSLAKAKLQELIDQLEGKQQHSSSDTPPANEVKEKPYDPAEIENIVESKIKANELKKKQTDNFNAVMTKLKERFGNNYYSVLKEQADMLGLDSEEINNLARKSPEAFFRTVGLVQEDRQDSFQNPPRSSQRNDSFAPKVQKRTWAYYQNMKKENPSAYHSRETNIQMQKDAIELGEAFNDGNFYS